MSLAALMRRGGLIFWIPGHKLTKWIGGLVRVSLLIKQILG